MFVFTFSKLIFLYQRNMFRTLFSCACVYLQWSGGRILAPVVGRLNKESFKQIGTQKQRLSQMLEHEKQRFYCQMIKGERTKVLFETCFSIRKNHEKINTHIINFHIKKGNCKESDIYVTFEFVWEFPVWKFCCLGPRRGFDCIPLSSFYIMRKLFIPCTREKRINRLLEYVYF